MIPLINSRARRALHRSPSAQREAGVVLIVVMVLLVAVTFMSISVMRSTLSSDLITNNNRTQTLAMEVAQLALRFCEDDLMKGSQATLFTDAVQIQPKVAPSTQMRWQKKDSWEGTGSTLVAKELSEDNLKSANTPFVPSKKPQCLAEYDPNADGVIVMTARGFSPDYKSDSDDKISAGSVVWLQSRFVFQSGGSGGGTSGGTGTGTGTGSGTGT